MAKKKVRFVVAVGEHRHQLFSVTEGAEGGLTISANRGATTDHPLTGREATKLDKTSVHLSERISGYTITQELIYQSGDERKWATVVQVPHGFAWLIHSRFNPGHYTPPDNPVKPGIIYELADYDPMESTFSYALFVAEHTFKFHDTVKRPRVIHKFKKFQIIVFSGTLEGRAPYSGGFYNLPKGRERFNNEELPDEPTYSAIGIPSSYLWAIVKISLIDMRNRWLHYILLQLGLEHYLKANAATLHIANTVAIPDPQEGEPEVEEFLRKIGYTFEPDADTG